MIQAQADAPSVALSFANNFWGKDDAGVGPLLERMAGAKQTCDELRAFYNTRASIEDEYARKLLSLCRKPLGTHETGSLKVSLDVMRGEVESMAKQHQSIAMQMKSELEEPLGAFAGAMKERRKIVQTGIEKLHKLKTQQTAHVNKTRDRYENECLKIKGYLAQGHMVMGQEERKNKAKLEKTQISVATSNSEYEAAVRVLDETTARWNREWKAAADKFQDLEEERLDFTKSSLWSFANIASTVCVSDDASCEKIRLSLEKLEVERDIATFISERGTGQEIPDPPKYVNFCRGDADSQSEASDEENYSVAQFPRSINPAYRTSSPQPSTYESHHDPNNSALARDLGHDDAKKQTPKKSTVPRATVQDVPYQGTPRLQSVQQAKQIQQPVQQPVQQQAKQLQIQAPTYAADEFAAVPHDPYPMDGMTMLCRTAPAGNMGLPVSELGSQVSSNSAATTASGRPSSRDSHSDVSNLTPYSSHEGLASGASGQASGQVSPTKMDGATSAVVPVDDKKVMKRRSGFFQNHSPFRRKSQKDRTWQGHQPNSYQSQSEHQSQSQSRNQIEHNQSQGQIQSQGQSRSRNQIQSQIQIQSHSNNQIQSQSQYHNQIQSHNNNHHNQSYDHPGFAGMLHDRTASPDPIDANASLALNVGQNVFPVANTDRRAATQEPAMAAMADDDPIALALAELKGVTIGKQSSVRVSADHYAGIATPAPGARSGQGAQNSAVSAAMRGTPPPSYDHQVQRLGVPAPAVTSKAMKQASQKYTEQTRSMFSANSGPTRQPMPSRNSYDIPRAASPAPRRSTSPRPGTSAMYGQDSRMDARMDGRMSQRSASPNPYASNSAHRSASPNPYASNNTHRSASPNPYASQRPTSQQQYGTSPHQGQAMTPKRGPSEQYYGTSMSRAASPSPYHQRPSSSMGGDMAVQLAPTGPTGYDDGYGSSRSRGSIRPNSSQSRPGTSGSGSRAMGLYEPGTGGAVRARSKSVADGRQYTRDGRPILHFARALFVYQAAIPEELGFSKGDTLAVLRHQDDGWWEATVHGGSGQVGLVPSNYLQAV